jgi:methionyl-tRNA synthetase
MSKSTVTAIRPSEVVDHFGVDAYRYYFLRTIAFGSDGSFSWEHLTAVYTAELANGLGNLASRVTAMTGRYFGGRLPAALEVTSADRNLMDRLTEVVRTADGAVERLALHEAIGAVESYVTAVNGYLSDQQPWTIARSGGDLGRVGTILATAAEALRAIAVLHHPVMPRAAQALWSSLGADTAIGPLAEQRIGAAARWGQLPAGSVLTKTAPLFPRLVEPDTAE